MALALTDAQASRAADAVTARCNSGVVRLYSGTPPATADTALSGNTLLAELSFSATAFGAASNGVATANAITQDSAIDASGTATFFRAFETGGTTVVFQGTCGASGADLNISPSAALVQNGTLSITSMTYTQPKS